MQASRRLLLRKLRGALRASLRLAAMLAVTAVLYPAIVLVRPFLSRRRGDAWANRVFRRWAAVLAWLLGMRLEVRGEAPRPPFLLVCNHLSYVDVLLLGAAAGGVFVAKREIASWPLVGSLCRAANTVFIDRGAKRDLVRVARLIDGALEAGRGVVLFPEGTTGDGAALLPFRSSLLEVAVREGLQVHCAGIAYRVPDGGPAARRAVCWHGGVPFLPHALRLLALPGFEARVRFSPRTLEGDDRKRLARRLRDETARQLAALDADR